MPRQAKESTHDDKLNKSNKDNESDDDDDDDDEVELRALAAAWVNEREEESPPAPARATPPTTRSGSSLSLHITQLPFDTTEWELRQFFVAHAGCSFQALRLVYDAGVEQERVFRGVAFGECSNQAQYQAALALHQSHQHKIKGRRINVRPTRTKEELASIVQERNTLVRTKLQTLSQKRKQSTSATSRDRNHDRDNKKTTSKRQRKDVSSPSSNAKTHRERKQPHNDNKKKLTKKERNRRAAIIMAKK